MLNQGPHVPVDPAMQTQSSNESLPGGEVEKARQDVHDEAPVTL